MTQLTFAFETVPATSPTESVVPASHLAPPVDPEPANVVVHGRFPRRQRRTGLKQLADVLVDVLDRYSETND